MYIIEMVDLIIGSCKGNVKFFSEKRIETLRNLVFVRNTINRAKSVWWLLVWCTCFIQ